MLYSFLVMLALIVRQKKKLGLVIQEKKFKITQFPFTAIIHEIHLMGVGFMSKPIIQKHERFVKVLNEDEVYIYKQSFPFGNGKKSSVDCHACQDLYGHIKGENINQDPFLSKTIFWKQE